MIVKKDNLFYISLSLLIIIIVGSRGQTPDTQGYFEVFKNIDYYDLSNPRDFYEYTGFEVGLGWIFKIVSIFTSSSFLLFSFCSFLIFLFNYISCKYIDLRVSVFFVAYILSTYFIVQQFMQFRQGLSIAVFYCGFFLLLKNIKKYNEYFYIVLLFFLSIALHQSSLLLIVFALIFYFYSKVCSFSKFIEISLILMVGTLVYLISYFYLSDYMVLNFERVEEYSNSLYSESTNVFGLTYLRLLIISIFLFFISTRKLFDDIYIRALMWCFAIGVALKLGFSDFGILSARLSTGFSYSELFLIPYVLYFRFNQFYFYVFFIIYILINFIMAYAVQMNLAEFLFKYSTPLY